MSERQIHRNDSPDIGHEPVQADPMFHERRAGAVGISAAVLATMLIVIMVLYGLSQPSRQEASNTAPSAATNSETNPNTGTSGPGTTGQGTTGQGTVNRARPIPQEQDPVEQSTRP